MNKLADYLRRNPARVYGAAVAVVALVAFYLPATPVALVLGAVSAVLALLGGDQVQRTENRKTSEALAQNPDPNAP